MITAEGTALDELGNYLLTLPTGTPVSINLFSENDMTDAEVQLIQNELLLNGFTLLRPVTYGSRILNITMEIPQSVPSTPDTEARGWLIPVVILLSVLGGGFFLWQTSENFNDVFPQVDTTFYILAGGAALVVLFGMMMFMRR